MRDKIRRWDTPKTWAVFVMLCVALVIGAAVGATVRAYFLAGQNATLAAPVKAGCDRGFITDPEQCEAAEQAAVDTTQVTALPPPGLTVTEVRREINAALRALPPDPTPEQFATAIDEGVTRFVDANPDRMRPTEAQVAAAIFLALPDALETYFEANPVAAPEVTPEQVTAAVAELLGRPSFVLDLAACTLTTTYGTGANTVIEVTTVQGCPPPQPEPEPTPEPTPTPEPEPTTEPEPTGLFPN